MSSKKIKKRTFRLYSVENKSFCYYTKGHLTKKTYRKYHPELKKHVEFNHTRAR